MYKRSNQVWHVVCDHLGYDHWKKWKSLTNPNNKKNNGKAKYTQSFEDYINEVKSRKEKE